MSKRVMDDDYVNREVRHTCLIDKTNKHNDTDTATKSRATSKIDNLCLIALLTANNRQLGDALVRRLPLVMISCLLFSF